MVARPTKSANSFASSAGFKIGSFYFARIHFFRIRRIGSGNQSPDVHPRAGCSVCDFFYSLTKRFTSATHFFLGLALAVAPVGAWIAQTGRIDVAPLVLAAGVICWVAGFDLIYATQDYDFDRQEGIRSLVVKLGITRSFHLAELLHLFTFVALIGFGLLAKLGSLYYWSMPLIAAALVYEHKIEKLDLGGINRAFFQSNAFVSAVFLLAVCVDRLMR